MGYCAICKCGFRVYAKTSAEANKEMEKHYNGEEPSNGHFWSWDSPFRVSNEFVHRVKGLPPFVRARLYASRRKNPKALSLNRPTKRGWGASKFSVDDIRAHYIRSECVS